MTQKAATPLPPSAPSWLKHVALLTGVLAALSGFLTYRTNVLSNAVLSENNQAVLAQTQASDKWTEFQADSIKARMVETELEGSTSFSPADRAELTQYAEEARQRQPVLSQEATDLEGQREVHLKIGIQRGREKNILGYGSTCVSLAIALASVAALTQKRIAFNIAVLAGLAGVGITIYGLIVAHLLQT